MNFKIFYICIIVIVQFCFTNSLVFSEENSGVEIKFANTLFIEHFSDVLYNNVRSDHKTLGDKPSFYLNEKFQIYFVTPTGGDDIELLNMGCVPIPPSLYISANFIYAHHENFAVRVGAEIEGGLGDYKNPFLSAGMGLTYINDMVFENSIEIEDPVFFDLNMFFKIGFRDDMHFFFDFSGVLNDAGGYNVYKDYYDLDITIGYKKILPLFFRFNAYITYINSGIEKGSDFQYSYSHDICFTHLQYYGKLYGLSAGYIYNDEEYYKVTYNADRTVSLSANRLDRRKSQGGGITFYIRNENNTAEIFGEFHLLADSDKNWMSISKFGVKAYF